MNLNKIIITSLVCTISFVSQANTAEYPYAPQAYACLEDYDLGNFDLAYQQCLPLAQKNDPLAQYVVAMLYKRGKAVKRSQQASLLWLERSAKGGYAASQLRLGKLLSTTTASPEDLTKAVHYFTQAANQHEKEAQFLLALCYENGIGVTQNTQTALHWYNKAVEQGLDAPTLTMTQAHEKLSLGNKASKPDDFTVLKMAAENGDKDAQFKVAMHYVNGQDTIQDDAKAIDWLIKSAAQNNTKAMSYLAWMSMLGIGMPQNVSQAVTWFVSAHEEPKSIEDILFSFSPHATSQDAKVSVNTQYDQAITLLKENTTDENAIALLKQAAMSNHAQAQAKLGQLYQTGNGVKQNKQTAAKWYEKAAKNGNSEAQYALGWMYYHGEGVTKNLVQSYYWFNQATVYGGAKAKSAKEFIRAQLSTQDLAKIESTAKVAKK